MIKKIISVFFVFSGVFMLLMLFQTIPSEIQSGQTLVAIIDLLFLGLYSLSIFGGIQLWRDKAIGKIICWYLLLAQSITISSKWFAYKFTSLVDVFIYYQSAIGLDSYFGAGRFELLFRSQSDFMIGFNIVSIGLLAVLSKKFIPPKISKLVAWINEKEAQKTSNNFV